MRTRIVSAVLGALLSAAGAVTLHVAAADRKVSARVPPDLSHTARLPHITPREPGRSPSPGLDDGGLVPSQA